MAITRWKLWYGRWWMVQFCWDRWLSLGIHADFARRLTRGGLTYGPYLDLHLGPLILSAGNRPVLSGELERSVSVSRGGIPADIYQGP